MTRNSGLLRLSTLILGLIMLAIPPQSITAHASPRATEFKLSNGLEVVVIPDHRAPVVTHMIWYRVGAADEPKGVSGIAHFLEHLMFKSTDKIPMGEFSKIVSRLGGQDNAFTGHDVTSYFQRIAKEKLETVMGMEADRMVNLRLTEKEVVTERDVIIEERRSRIENNPSAVLDEQMDASLYFSHPYGIPVIGWPKEMARLSQADAISFYKRFYAPNNAILVVAGDVEPSEVKALAEKTYGQIPANPAVEGARNRSQTPLYVAPRRVELRDPRAGNPSFHRDYLVPAYTTAEPGVAEALDLLGKVMLDGPTSRLYRKLVVEEQIASSAGGGYQGTSLDSGKMSIYAVANDEKDMDKIEATIDAVIEDIKKNGVTAAELERAKFGYIADYTYDSDNQASLARRYGWSRAIGRSIAQIESWPDAIAKVTVDDIKKAAAAHLDIGRSVTGKLLPEAAAAADGSAAQPAPKSRS